MLDRIVFVRIAEDRHVIEKNQLRDVVEEWKARGDKIHIFEWLNDLFHRINEDFNGEIFKPHLSEEIRIDSDLLAKIIERLYPPKSHYRFDAMGVELLGSIYERYLGKTIHTTVKQVRVEEKPEVRKAGGVYYTPKYIVDFIVKETVGKIIEGKTPKQIEKIRILDPACGSGSFLIGAFQCLIEYHVRYLTEHPKDALGHALFPDIIREPSGEPRLSVVRKAEILKNNLFGVDIDAQAVEITMMSLYLKALEGERSQLPPKHHLLPELKYNIICGNSLIGPEISGQGTFFGDSDTERINSFDWAASFSEILKSGGFDGVIGNPPYVRIQHLKEWAPIEVEYYKKLYKAASSGNYDLYVVFVEKGLDLLKTGGRLGYILPNKFFNAQYGKPLRALLATGRNLSEVVHFGDKQVFEGATNYTCLLFLEKPGKSRFRFSKVGDLEAWRNFGRAQTGMISATQVTSDEWNFATGPSAALCKRLSELPRRLGDVADIFVGLQTSADDVFIMELVEELPRTLRLSSKSLGAIVDLEKPLLYPLLSGTDVDEYGGLPRRQYILFPYKVANEIATLIDIAEISKDHPKIASYLAANKKRLENRENGKFRGRDWYRFGRNQNLGIQSRSKLCVPRLVQTLVAAYDSDGTHFLDNVDVGGITLKIEYKDQELLYLLGLLNSSLLRWNFPFVSAPFHGGWMSANRQFLSQLPICVLNLSNASEKTTHTLMLKLVTRMLDANQRKRSTNRAPSEIVRVDREIASIKKEIDELVFKIYNVSDKERGLIEEEIHD